MLFSVEVRELWLEGADHCPFFTFCLHFLAE